jgi:UDP:flavonoid glycosyltransferase YjiC (YdhE family)
MKFVAAGYGSRGDVEPCVAVGRQLLRRGHDVRMAVPPNMLGFVESAGLAAFAYGPDSQAVEEFRRDLSKIQNPISKVREVTEHVTAACAQLGERALIESGTNDFVQIPHAEHVKVVKTLGQAAIFPLCRAVVHHGGAGTTAASLRAGIPTLILFAFWLDQPIWAAAIEQLKVGFGRHFSETTVDTLFADLRSVLDPRYVAQAREVAAQMTKAAESRARAADLLEDAAS